MTKEQKEFLIRLTENSFTPTKPVFYVSELIMKKFEEIYKKDKVKKIYKK